MPAKTLFEKLWAEHRIKSYVNGDDLIAIDRVFLHERTGAFALRSLEEKGRSVRFPAQVFCTMDHIVSNSPGRGRNSTRMPGGEAFISATRNAALASGIQLIDVDDPRQGIVHVIAPELGIVQPGMTVVCPDSHTCSLGALGALAWGIGSTDAEHAMATGTLRLTVPRTMRIRLTGTPPPGLAAKDIVLSLIAHLGADGAAGHAVEFTGPALRELDIEARLTLCNMAVEFAAFTAVIAPDERTIAYLKGRQFSVAPDKLDAAKSWWRTLHTDDDADFDREVSFETSRLEPCVTWGTSPEQAAPLGARVPDPAALPASRRASALKALAYMDLRPGQTLKGMPIDGALIGSCTNGRLSDLRAAAGVLRGQHIAPHVKAICIPGSQVVKRAAEEEGIADIFRRAGFTWGEPGCGLCFYAGGDTFAPGSRVASTTNRNFEGRQGPRVRTHLCSPATVAASAVAGVIADSRDMQDLEASP